MFDFALAERENLVLMGCKLSAASTKGYNRVKANAVNKERRINLPVALLNREVVLQQWEMQVVCLDEEMFAQEDSEFVFDAT